MKLVDLDMYGQTGHNVHGPARLSSCLDLWRNVANVVNLHMN